MRKRVAGYYDNLAGSNLQIRSFFVFCLKKKKIKKLIKLIMEKI